MIALDFLGTTHQSSSHNVAFNQVINQSVNQARDISPGTDNLKPSLTGHANSAPWAHNHCGSEITISDLTSPHDPLGITDSACKNHLVMVSIQYGPFNTYIPIRSTTIGKSRVARDLIAMHTSWRSNSDIASVTRLLAPTSFTRKPALQTVGGGRSSIRSTTGINLPPSICTRRSDGFCHGRNLLIAVIETRIQLAVGPQPLRLRNHNFGLVHRIMVKRLVTSPHDPLGITDSSCKNQLVVVSVQYGPFNTYIPIRSTTIGKSRVARDPIAMHTSWRSNSDIESVTRTKQTSSKVTVEQSAVGIYESVTRHWNQSQDTRNTLTLKPVGVNSTLLDSNKEGYLVVSRKEGYLLVSRKEAPAGFSLRSTCWFLAKKHLLVSP
ncbi:hypothetical protein F511_34345 [Dorcoceras hygrometricum]|uniref:Uncharacterized protein n=1 Tax=Dorcoceras hygrometricum TaxID=472368 RepID=A0A2Z7AFB8_9LAMI|nr:hypothetical protein F511_34345 [Dorcoceras hygrometricum]